MDDNKHFWLQMGIGFLMVITIVLGVLFILAVTKVDIVLSSAAKAEPVAAPRVVIPEVKWEYELSYEEYKVVVETVAAEANCEDFIGKALIAQCILNSAVADGIRPDEVVVKYKYADPYKGEIQDNVSTAVISVFKYGLKPVEADIQFFYSPGNMPEDVSFWHESLDFVVEYGGHRFFKLGGE